MRRRIKSLPLSLRPREKLLKSGPSSLTDTELLMTILVTGTKKRSVQEIATDIFKLKKKSLLTHETLKQIGVGSSKIAQILAIEEIIHRTKPLEVTKLTSPDLVYIQSLDILHKEKESLLCYYLNARGELLKRETIAVGTLNKVRTLPTDIFSVIKELPVSDIILVHNHPSGNLDASDDDILFTKRIQKAGEIIGIKLLDHLIISNMGWKKVSF